MQLDIRVDGEGPRTAVLIHGLMSDSRAWHRVRRDLLADGYRVLSPDLAGHGTSPRSHRYSPQAWAEDVAETLEPLLTDGPPTLLLGHSLGALVAGLLVGELAPRAAVYADPAFALPRGLRGLALQAMFALSPRPGSAALRRMNPRWDEKDLAIELATLRRWDRRTLLGLADRRRLVPPPAGPGLVLLAERSLLIDDRAAAVLREQGLTVVALPGTGHTLFRDDHDGFMRLVADWVAAAPPIPSG